MNDAALLDSLHAALRNPDLAWYTEFHAGESIVAGYLDSLTDPYDDDAIQVPEGWFRYSVVTREGDHALPWMEHWNEYEYSITHHIDWNGKGFTPYDLYCTQDLTGMIAASRGLGLGSGCRFAFIVESEATAADTDEPPLDELITAATHEYLDSGMTYDGFSEHVRTTWRNAAAYDWSKLMAEPRSTGEWSSDANRLAVLGVMMQFAPESTCMMIASDILAENAPLSLPALRERINTPDGMVNTDLLFSRLIDNGTTPDPARIDMAMGILGPLEANAPTDACYRIIGLKAMLSLAMGDGEKARELAEQAIGYDASDRFASSVLDRLPETDPAMEAANVWENGGHLGR